MRKEYDNVTQKQMSGKISICCEGEDRSHGMLGDSGMTGIKILDWVGIWGSGLSP